MEETGQSPGPRGHQQAVVLPSVQDANYVAFAEDRQSLGRRAEALIGIAANPNLHI